MHDQMGNLETVISLFDESCATFRRLLANADEVADAMDFTGKLHELAIQAGRVQGLGEALAALSGDQTWHTRVTMTLREYLDSSIDQDSNGHDMAS